jgi:hypothetical protein
MRTYVGDQEAVNAFEFEELAYGFDEPIPNDFRELFLLGAPGESDEECAARLTVAREVLAELQEEGETDLIARENARYAKALSSVVLLRNRVGAARAAAWARKVA